MGMECFIPKGQLHPIDEEGFKEHPQPLYEAITRLHPVRVNACTPHYGTLIYSLIRAVQAFNVVEIGVGYGWVSWFMAMAVKENNSAFKQNGRYLAIDINPATKDLFDHLKKEDGLPIEYIYTDSKNIKSEDLLLNGAGLVDVLFQDGNHKPEHCIKELDYIYPVLKDRGNGYLICHDTYSWCEEYLKIILNNPKYKWEYVSFPYNYGLTILRKMDNYDHNLVHWPMTPEMRAQEVW